MSTKPKNKRALQANATRDKAEALLEGLLRAKQESERQAAYHAYASAQRAEATRAAVDQAIASTRRVIAQLNSQMKRSPSSAAQCLKSAD